MHITTETRAIVRSITNNQGITDTVHFTGTLTKIHAPSLGVPTAIEVNGLWFTPVFDSHAESLDEKWKEAGR